MHKEFDRLILKFPRVNEGLKIEISNFFSLTLIFFSSSFSKTYLMVFLLYTRSAYLTGLLCNQNQIINQN